ncbi:MAG: hypothetical protein P8M65_03505 [Roseibacillus sp.]|jgi:hypothetical protein|nr:hypothetical protein [Roseibacillus sp.]
MKISAGIALAYFILVGWGWKLWSDERYGLVLLTALIAFLIGAVIDLYRRVRGFSKQLATFDMSTENFTRPL